MGEAFANKIKGENTETETNEKEGVGVGYVFIGLYLLIVVFVIEIAVSVLVMTGLEKEVARYQAVSMLTSTGFTTDESQLIIDHPIRRRISLFLILFGVFSLAVVISAITNILSNDLKLGTALTINLGLLVLLVFLKLPPVQAKAKKLFDYEMKKNLDISEMPIKEVLFLNEEDIVTDVIVDEDSYLDGRKVSETIEAGMDINLLFIERGEVAIRKDLHDQTIQAGDKLFVYGDKSEIEQLTKEVEPELRH